MAELPMHSDSMVQGLGYSNPPAPTTDSMATTESGPILGIPNPVPSPMVVVSLATTSNVIPPNTVGSEVRTGYHGATFTNGPRGLGSD